MNEDQGREIPSKSDHPLTPHKPPTFQTQITFLSKPGALVILLEFPDLQTNEQALVEAPLTFPYVPGLSSFRAALGILAAV